MHTVKASVVPSSPFKLWGREFTRELLVTSTLPGSEESWPSVCGYGKSFADLLCSVSWTKYFHPYPSHLLLTFILIFQRWLRNWISLKKKKDKSILFNNEKNLCYYTMTLFIYLFIERISHSQVWPYDIAESDMEFMILLNPPPKHYLELEMYASMPCWLWLSKVHCLSLFFFVI